MPGVAAHLNDQDLNCVPETQNPMPGNIPCGCHEDVEIAGSRGEAKTLVSPSQQCLSLP